MKICATSQFSELTSVLVRLRQSLQGNMTSGDDASYVGLEWSALLNGWLQSLPCRVINRPRPGAGQRCPEHRVVAEALHACGFAAPETLVTGSADAMRRFLARQRHGVVASSPAGIGAWYVPHRDVSSFPQTGWKPVPPLQNGPRRLQAVPRGPARRVLVVGEKVFAAEEAMASVVGTVGEPWRRVSLPTAVGRCCVRLARRLELEFVELLLVLSERRPVVFQIADLPNPVRCETALHETIVAALIARLKTPQPSVTVARQSAARLARESAFGGALPRRRYDAL